MREVFKLEGILHGIEENIQELYEVYHLHICKPNSNPDLEELRKENEEIKKDYERVNQQNEEIRKENEDIKSKVENLSIDIERMKGLYLEREVSKLQEMDAELENKIARLETSNCDGHSNYTSAFTVYVPISGPTSDTISFQEEIENIGGHFNHSTGQFVCEYDGIYVFSLYIYRRNSSSADCRIRKNSKGMVRGYRYGTTTESSTSVVVHLERGDVIDIGACSGSSTLNFHTVFTGFLLKAS